MSDPVYSKSFDGAPQVEAPLAFSHGEHAYNLDEKAHVADYKADAIEAENAEHNMGVLEAVRAYPMASFWAFVMSFTIVSCLPPFPLNLSSDEEIAANTILRLWSPTTSSSSAISSPYLRSRTNTVYSTPQPANLSSRPNGSLHFKCLGSSVRLSASSSLAPSPAASDIVTRP